MDVAFLLDKYFKDEKYRDITEAEALKLCLQDKITDGKGLGFGLYTTSRLVDSIGKKFVLHSGKHKLVREGRTQVRWLTIGA